MARLPIALLSLVFVATACAEKPGTKKADDKEAKDGKGAKTTDAKTTDAKPNTKDAKPGG